MTICVAAFAFNHDGPTIVAAADTKLSFQYDSIDTAMKIRRINKNWLFCFAATDASASEQIVADLRQEIGEQSALNEVARVAKAIHNRYQNENSVWQFLLAGFDENKAPHLFTIAGSDGIRYCDGQSFCSIGSGQHLAESFLCSYPYRRGLTMEEAIYSVLVAKFTAERADGVGRDTFATVLRPSQMYLETGLPFIESHLIEWIRECWESLPRIPDGVSSKIGQYLDAKKRLLF
jgi:20S proteasome alpha/beta subunit